MHPDYPRFHLAIPVSDLNDARVFYGEALGCATGRESARWIDFDFFGHQLVAHQVDASQLDAPAPDGATNKVEGHDVPASHFGIVLAWEDYRALLSRLTDAGIEFAIDHHVRFGGRPGEQATFFLQDPSGNYLEFKTFRNIEMMFAKDLENY